MVQVLENDPFVSFKPLQRVVPAFAAVEKRLTSACHTIQSNCVCCVQLLNLRFQLGDPGFQLRRVWSAVVGDVYDLVPRPRPRRFIAPDEEQGGETEC